MARADDMHKVRKGREVLRHLAEYGMLSTKSLAEFLGHSGVDGRTCHILARLVDRGLIRRSGRGAGANHEVRYQLSQDKRMLAQTSVLIGRPVEYLIQGNRRACDAVHESQCGRLHYFLAQRYPNSTVFRPWRFLKDSRLKVLRLKFSSGALWPDLILRADPRDFPSTGALRGRVAFIAFEVENSIKSRKKILQKALRLGNYGAFDGVLYLLPVEQVRHIFWEIYAAHALPKLLRTSHYGNTFYGASLFSDTSKDIGSLPILSSTKTMHLHDWCTYLVTTPFLDRRNW